MRRRVFVTTATGGLSTRTAPVGGGVAVLEALYPFLAAAPGLETWVLQPGPADGEVRAQGLQRVTLRVASLAGRSAEALLALDERGYARFAFEWEAALARFFERVDPTGAVVVANDVSEGPPFEELARRGFAQLVLYHVVVGEFFARQYLRAGRAIGLSAPTAARWWRAAERTGLARLQPRLLELVWRKESQAARCAAGVVPSAAMARELAAIYPWTGIAQRTHVVPWGVIGAPAPARRARRAEVLARLGLAPERFVLLTLSRISREKRLELAVRALRRLERESPALADRLALVVAGAPAYMGGRATLERLEREAARLERVHVRFAGYVADDARWELLSCSDLLLSTSSYEAYGLSIAQALASGTPALATDHQGARAILDGRPELGGVVRARERELARALRAAVDDASPEGRRAAAAWGRANGFEHAAQRLLELVRAAQPADVSRSAPADRENTRATR